MQLFSWLRMKMTARPRTRRAPSNRPAPRFRPRLEVLEGRDVPSTLTVMTNLDGVAGSLRAAITNAHAGDTIAFAQGLDGQTITLTGGELVLNKSLTIKGDGLVTISGNHASRVFEVDGSTTNVTLSGLTITQGNGMGGAAQGYGGDILDNGATLNVNNCTLSAGSASNSGGGICDVSGGLTLSGCTVTGNSTSGYGGGISNTGTSSVTLSTCTISGNTALSGGGGIDNHNTGTVTVSGGSVSGNTCQGVGGGIANWGTLSVTNATISDNSALSSDGGDISDMGGGVFNQGGTATLTGCTLSGNFAAYEGGAVWTVGTVTVSGKKPHTVTVVTGTMTISGCTVTGNSVDFGVGGGIYNASSSAATLTLLDSVFSNNGANLQFAYYGPATNGGGNTFS
jgi:hypothetical protein